MSGVESFLILVEGCASGVSEQSETLIHPAIDSK